MNIPEILVANGTGIILVVFLFLLRVRNSETKQTGAVLYDGMLAVTLVTLVALVTESFLNELDQKMYAEKKAYHQEHPR